MELAISAVIDIALLAVFIIIAKVYSDRGLIKSIIGLVGNIAALVIAIIFSAQLGAYINTNFVRDPMQQWLINTLSPTSSEENASINDLDFDGLFSDEPTFFTETLEFLNVDMESAKNQYEIYKQSGLEQARAAIVNTLTDPISSTVSRILAFILIFLLCLIAVRILWWLSNMIANIPVIRHLDRIGGTLIGLVTAALIVFIMVSVINMSFSYFLKDMSVSQKQEIVNKTVIYKNLNNINPLNGLFAEMNS